MEIPLVIPDNLHPGMVAILGLPLDENSSFHRGPALAPPAIRQVLNSGVGNWCCEAGQDLAQDPRWLDLGDLDLSDLHGWQAFQAITGAVSGLLEQEVRPLLLGGDHSVTFPIVRALAGKFPRLNLLHLDAHPDLYDNFEDNPLSHASPFARIMESGLASRLVQVGIRTRTPHQRHQAKRFGVETIEMRDWAARPLLSFDGPVYLSLDLDVFDPAFAPGVSHHEPGGLSTRQVLDFLQGLDCTLVGADIVEFNPTRDPSGITAALGAKLYKEVVAHLLEDRP
jgi:agmatinase